MMDWVEHLEPTRAAPIAPSAFLCPTKPGVVLWWVLDDDDDPTILVAHLTEGEATRVAKSTEGGMLEPVRADLRDRAALLMKGQEVATFKIPATGDEAEFIDGIYDMVERIESGDLPDATPPGKGARRATVDDLQRLQSVRRVMTRAPIYA